MKKCEEKNVSMLNTGKAFEQQPKSIQMLSLNLEPNLHKFIKQLQKLT